MKAKKTDPSTQKQRYIPVGKKLIPVSEETYLNHTRWVANERYRARRDHRCGSNNFSKCNGDCGHCIYQIPGDVLYMDSIIQAASDYRKALYRNSKRPYQADTLREIDSIERFFRSNWFSILTSLDGRQLLHDLKKDMGLEGRA